MTEPVEMLPKDEYNATLIANVHPVEWRNPAPAKQYHLVVIGAGTAGLVTAAGAAGLGAKVALVERGLFGGDCLNVGCVPSKCVIRSSRAAADIRRAPIFGAACPDAAVDFAAVMKRMRQVRTRISYHDSARRFRDLGVEVFLGGGKFTGPDTVEVDGKSLRFKKAVIATGSRPVHPPIEGLSEAGYLTNETVFSLTELPRRMAVLGAGPIGCELAQAFQRLGCAVTLLEVAPRIMIREDIDAAAVVAAALRLDGIDIRLNATAKKVIATAGERVIYLEIAGRTDTFTVDEILIGVGRAPNVEDLNLDAAGVRYDGKSGVFVDDTLRTTHPNIYAAGDVCLSHKFTHMADASARIVIQNALFHGRKKASALTIPWCTYTDPEIAHVGMFEDEAERRGMKVSTFTRTLSDVDRGVIDGEEEGFVRIHVKKRTDRILGATIVARHAGEMIGELSLAMTGGIGLKTIANVIHPYPTQAEAIRQIGDAYNRARLTPFAKRILSLALKW